MDIIKKLIFLYQSQANKLIHLNFVTTKLKNIFLKRYIKYKKKNHVEFLKKKNITHDYFSSHAYNFFNILNKFNSFKYLEIGSFEGNSAMFVAKNFPNANICCVDNWMGTEEYENMNFSSVEYNFDNNMSEFNNYKKFKLLSDEFFNNNQYKFDVIYIDGYHKGSQVLKDFMNSWKILNLGGVIIFDDYVWKFFDKIQDNPCYVINKYLEKIKKDVKILKVSNSQLFIQKINYT
jgi:predicted O-methyltransferase YrrM